MPYEKITSASPEAHSESPVPGNIAALAQLFPSVVQDGQVDFVALRTLLGDAVEDDEQERFGLHWNGKKMARQFAMQPSLGTLRPCKKESVNWDTTKNLYIEGDNLEVLKLLRKSYSGKVKMIYIDPPYNTGGDFVYKDNYQDSIANYKQVTGQEASYAVNTETSGRFHTNWLNFMLPRLMVARDLLRDDGAIFIHIDEHEVYSLSLICNEIFGESNQLGTIIWDKRNPKGAVAGVAYQHESILVYCKNISVFAGVQFTKKKEHAGAMFNEVNKLISRYGCVNEHVRQDYKRWIKEGKTELSGGEAAYALIDDEGNIYQAVSMAAPDKPETRSHRPIVHPVTNKPCPTPEKGWRFTDKKMDELLEQGRIEFGKDETTQPRQKYYLKENMDEAVASLLYFGGSDNAVGLPFDNPKPVAIAKKLICTVCKGNDEIVLDFFSGSATTAHAVMQLNAEDGGKRRFIMVQLPEVCKETTEAYKAGYKNICEIGKERIRRAGRKIKEEAGLAGANFDVGFRVYKLDSSNVRAWNPNVGEKNLLTQMEEQAAHLVSGRSGEDFLTEIMLKCGIDLTEEVTERKIAGHPVQNLGYGSYFACMDEDIAKDAEALALGIAAWRTEELKAAGIEGGDGGGCVVFVLDQAFDGQDAAKMNFVEILRQYGIDNVKAL